MANTYDICLVDIYYTFIITCTLNVLLDLFIKTQLCIFFHGEHGASSF